MFWAGKSTDLGQRFGLGKQKSGQCCGGSYTLFRLYFDEGAAHAAPLQPSRCEKHKRTAVAAHIIGETKSCCVLLSRCGKHVAGHVTGDPRKSLEITLGWSTATDRSFANGMRQGSMIKWETQPSLQTMGMVEDSVQTMNSAPSSGLLTQDLLSGTRVHNESQR